MRAAELEILEEARRWGLGRDLGSSATDMHMLAVLQHHGVSTRLIDVTSNPMTALWFAVEEHKPDEGGMSRRSAGVLFAIDVTKLRRLGMRHSSTAWVRRLDTWRTRLPRPIARRSTGLKKLEKCSDLSRHFPDERMNAQEGFFIGSSVPVSHRALASWGSIRWVPLRALKS